MNQADYKKFKHNRKDVTRMKIHKKDKSKFLFYFKKDGKLYRKLFDSPGSTSGMKIENAMKELNKFYESAGRVRNNLDSNIKMNDYWKLFVENKSDKWSDNHKRTMKGFYKNYIEYLIGNKSVVKVTTANIDDVMNGCKNKSLRLQKSILEIIEPLFKRAIRDGLIVDSPIDEEHQVKRNSNEEKKYVFNAGDKFVKVHQAIQEIDDLKIRTAFLFGFSGRRLQEVLSLTWDDINLDSASYIVRGENSKVNTTMEFSLDNQLLEALREIKAVRDSNYVFSSNRDSSIPMARLSQYYDEIREASGIPEFTFHWMRNLLVSTLANEGVSVEDLTSILGHQDTGTLKKYLSLQRKSAGVRANKKVDALLGKNKNESNMAIDATLIEEDEPEIVDTKPLLEKIDSILKK